MKKRIAALALAVAAILGLPAYVIAEDEYLPTVYIADDVWYKDKSQPMITDGKDGFFISIDAFGALPAVSAIYDSTVNAVRFKFEDTAFSADTVTGTVISPEGDRTVSIIKEYGTLYFSVDDVCEYLGLSCETHFYSNGKRAVRINDGSGTLDINVLIRMFVSQTETRTRMTGDPVSAYPSHVEKVSSTSDLGAALNRILDGDCEFIIALDADLVLSLSASELSAVMAEIYAAGIPVSLFAFKENADTVLHYVINANTRLLELMHRGACLCTPTLELTETDTVLIKQRGFLITEFTFEEEE